MKDLRKGVMEATRLRLKEELNKALSELNLNPHFEDLVFAIPKKKFKGVGVRGSMMYVIYEYIKEQADLEEFELGELRKNEYLFGTQIPFLAELIISVQYYANQILDGKGGLLEESQLNRSKVEDNLVASHYLKDFIYQYIEKYILPNDPKRQRLVRDTVRQIFQFTDYGQWAEKHYSSFDHFINGLEENPFARMEVEGVIDEAIVQEIWEAIRGCGISEDRASFVQFYLRRICLTNCSLFTLCGRLVLNLLQADFLKRKLAKFTTWYGLVAQMVNDVKDYLPSDKNPGTMTKIPLDAFADLRNNNLTLPFFFCYRDHSDGFDFEFFVRRLDQLEKQWEIFDLVKKACKEDVMPLLQILTKPARKELSDNQYWRSILIDFLSIAYNNRFFRRF